MHTAEELMNLKHSATIFYAGEKPLKCHARSPSDVASPAGVETVGELKLMATIVVDRYSQSSLVLQTFFFRMQENPAIQKQAQQEIDSVVGRGRLPSFADKSKLPFIDALYKELLRHSPAAPGGTSPARAAK